MAPLTLADLPAQTEEKRFKLVVFILNGKTGDPVPIDLHMAAALKTRLFSIAQVNKSINQAFENLAFKNSTFKAYARRTSTHGSESLMVTSAAELQRLDRKSTRFSDVRLCMILQSLQMRPLLTHVNFMIPAPSSDALHTMRVSTVCNLFAPFDLSTSKESRGSWSPSTLRTGPARPPATGSSS